MEERELLSRFRNESESKIRINFDFLVREVD